jgi:hypothetical protein
MSEMAGMIIPGHLTYPQPSFPRNQAVYEELAINAPPLTRQGKRPTETLPSIRSHKAAPFQGKAKCVFH